MSYQTVKCPRGHSFRANVVSRHQKIECPECKRRTDEDSSSSFSSSSDFIPTFSIPDTDWSSSTSSSSSDFSSGGGGDFGGGGASGDW